MVSKALSAESAICGREPWWVHVCYTARGPESGRGGPMPVVCHLLAGARPCRRRAAFRALGNLAWTGNAIGTLPALSVNPHSPEAVLETDSNRMCWIVPLSSAPRGD